MRDSCPIAIVGLGGLFPGAPDPAAFARNNREKIDATREVPPGRWILDPSEVFQSTYTPDKLYSLRGCFVEDFVFDPAGLKLDPAFLQGLDPLYPMTLHVGRQAFHDAVTGNLDLRRVGVILAAIALPTDASSTITRRILGRAFEEKILGRADDSPLFDAECSPLNSQVTSLPAALLADALGLGGGSYTLDAACASSLYAIKLACEELRAGRADAMLTGGVSRPECLYTQMGFSQLRALSPSGCCRPFEARGDGLVVGEGAGMMLLKRLDDALRDGDRVYAVIRGIGWSNDTAGSLLAADSEGQLRAMRLAYAEAGWQPHEIDYIEGHGTGTPVGDAAELESLHLLWKDAPWQPGQCALGSVKSMVGHLLTAAGAAGLIRTVLAMNGGWLPPTANFEQPADALARSKNPFRVLTTAEPWNRRDDQTPRRAAISAFGFGGINAHVLVEEWDPALVRFSASHRRDAGEVFSDTQSPSATLIGTPSASAGPTRAKSSVLGEAHDTDPLACARGSDSRHRPTNLRTEFRSHRSLNTHDADTTPLSGNALGIEECKDAPVPIAIVGMETRFGRLESLREFQETTLAGDSIVESRPAQRWRGGDEPARRWLGVDTPGAFINDVSIPIGRYRLPPNEIPEALPQQLLMLQTVDQALADAGLTERQRRERAGVIVGMALDLNTSNFHFRWVLERQARTWAARLGLNLTEAQFQSWVDQLRAQASEPLNAGRVQGSLGGLIASRIAREFGFGGPSFTVSAAEASGLRALEIGVRSLQRGELDLVVVGAVDLCGDVRSICCTHALRAYSRTGQARPFDMRGGGGTIGEGAVALVLKRLPDAQRDGNRVYAVVRGLGFAGGSKQGYPSEQAYRAAIERACADAKVDPRTIHYLETHGSGEPTEDRIEGRALLDYFTSAGTRLCALGSVKAHIGHTGSAAGLASVARAALCLYQEMIPPLPDFMAGPSDLDWGETFHLPRFPQSWLRDRADGPRRAGVSALTIDGLCGHVVLEAAEQTADTFTVERRQPLGARRPAIFAVEGDDVAALLAGLDALQAFLNQHDGPIEPLTRAWHGQYHGKRKHRRAIALLSGDAEHLRSATAAARYALRNDPDTAIEGRDGIYYSPEPLADQGELAFVFPGSGNHYLGMGRGISTHWPEVLRNLDHESQRLASQMMPRWYMPWRSTWEPGWEAEAAAAINAEYLRMIMGQVAHGVAMSDLLRMLGLRPKAVIGYSLGETTSLFALRAWRDRDEMLRRMSESPLFQTDLAGACLAARKAWGLSTDESVDWRVAVVNRPADKVRRAVARVKHAYLLITNAPDECVVGGHWQAVEKVVRKLKCDAFNLNGAATVHCDVFREAESAYRHLHLLETTPPPGVRFYSCAWARAYDLDSDSAAASIVAQALRGFDFPATIEQAYADGVRLFVEPGPQASCSRMIDKILGPRPHLARSASLFGQDEVTTVLKLLAALVTERAITDLTPLYGQETRVVAHRLPDTKDSSRPSIIVATGRAALDTKIAIDFRNAFDAGVTGTTPGELGLKVPPYHAPQPPSGRVRQPLSLSTPTPRADVEAAYTADTLAADVVRTGRVDAQAHESFLRFSQTATEGTGYALALQARLLEVMGGRLDQLPRPASHGPTVSPTRPTAPPPAYPRELCMEFAIGSLAKVLGPEFAIVDSYPVRVRLPDEPLMLVDRIVSVAGEKGALTSGQVVTEHDVLPGAWYLDNDRCPTSITIEAGQADLFLCSYLGIDLAVKGKRAYRLLDATVTFHQGLPRPGQVIHYDIAIERFIRQGDVYLFFFRFQGSIDGRPVVTMRDGCAGFFTPEEIRDSGGIVLTAEERKPAAGRRPDDWSELVPMAVESYDEKQIDALRNGDLAGCFGSAFAGLDLQNPPRLPGGRMRLVHRVARIDPRGGRYGMGLIRAEADIHPDDWFLTCHFVDDMVMPGTLMYECCLHTLRIYLLRMGWIGEHDQIAYEPLPGIWSELRCRGPVTPQTRMVTYEVQIKEFGYNPEPYVIADAFMYSDDKMTVYFKDMALRIAGLSREQIENLWRERPSPVTPIGETVPDLSRKPAVFDTDRILAFAVGNPSEAFGEPYKMFDRDRRMARLPGPPYSFITRITETNARPWQLESGGWVEAQYDVPPDAWYFRANRQSSMPFSILLEIGLQTCGFQAAFMGSALHSDSDLFFRNLGGTGTQYAEVFPDAGTLTTRARATGVSKAGGMIIEEFDLQVWRGSQLVYNGHTNFGFFTESALAQQVGIRNAAERAYVPSESERQRGRRIVLEQIPPLTPDDGPIEPDFAENCGNDASPVRTQARRLCHTEPDQLVPPDPAAALPARALLMIDEVDLFIPDGGPHGLGYIHGIKKVDPDEWFFKAHFYQDPVCPGSLGLESFLQLLKVVALEKWGRTLGNTHRFTPILIGAAHRWQYRGQILPTGQLVEVEAVVAEIREYPTPLVKADGFLKIDGTVIYEMLDFGVIMVPVD
ncbi:MAG: type I polyketide synthase [Phycisphaerales bacterium]|nr:type I polyketide synthase [Phycisphaerales bacterium]